MIRRGKAAGWLQLPSEALLQWALLNDVAFTSVVPGAASGRGVGLFASHHLPRPRVEDGSGLSPLLTVPKDLILSYERVCEHAKADVDLREVLECLGDFGKTPRGAILTFLLSQISISCPDLPERVGVHSPYTDYVKALPLEDLPTFWSESERRLLVGTTLAPAVTSKMKSLSREYALLESSASASRWFKIVDGLITFDDWMLVDAMYRSRALDFPGIGHCMVPCIDLANHASGEETVAVYEKDGDGNAMLLLRDGKSVSEGGEVTITYGDEKGACEMLFSYGFLDGHMESAETVFLSLAIPDSDMFKSAKMEAADCAPGFKLIDTKDGKIDWTGDFIWVMCVNEDDGLRFELAKTVDGQGEEVEAFFQDQELTAGASQLYRLLSQSDLWAVYRLRAITILQQRVFDQMQILHSTHGEVRATGHGSGTDVRDRTYELALHIRELEYQLLGQAYEDFERQKVELAASDVVERYLASVHNESLADEDFS